MSKSTEPPSFDNQSRPTACKKTHCSSHDQFELKCGCILPMMSAACFADVQASAKMPVAVGWLNGKKVTVLRDSGSSCVVIRKGLVEQKVKKDNSRKTVNVYLADGQAVPAPVTEAYLESPYFVGSVSALEMANPMYDVNLGNIPDVKCPGISVPEPIPEVNDKHKPQEVVTAVETRAGKTRRTKSPITLPAIACRISVSKLKELQQHDKSLAVCRKLADTGETRTSGKGNRTRYGYDLNGILIRMFSSVKMKFDEEGKQVVVPEKLRNSVMHAAYDSIGRGHLTAKETTDKLLGEFFWPNIWNDVKRYCQSCDQSMWTYPNKQMVSSCVSKIKRSDEPFKLRKKKPRITKSESWRHLVPNKYSC
ncbi:reverse transcriptase [Elysia marginata]|uniref:Reverse transcriptase n=1 Tax=Elysia marginata TaxID=1093978 RepID=A0AAV4GL77_9GAST|nr:reverse transcriptase [Elysia marginata]